MNLAQPAGETSLHAHLRAAPRMQPRKWVRHRRQRQRCGQCGEIAFDIEEVDRARRRSPLFRFAGAERKAANAYRLCEVVARKRAANFEDAYARMLALEIGLQRRNEPGQERRSHDVEMRCDRIQHRDQL